VVREVLAIKVDTSLSAKRVIPVLEQLMESHHLPRQSGPTTVQR
jgi:hypothetical protein